MARRATVLERYRRDPVPTLTLVGADEFSPDTELPDPAKTGDASPEAVRAVYDALHVDCGMLSAGAAAWFGSSRPRNFFEVGDTPVTKRFHVGGVPVAVILLSQLPLAGVTIPVVFFLRGFFLSYGIVALMEGMGLSGVLCAGVVFGPTCLLAVPVLFVLGTTGLLRKAESQPKGIPFFRRMVASLLVLALCVFLDQAVVPKLLGILLKALTMVSG